MTGLQHMIFYHMDAFCSITSHENVIIFIQIWHKMQFNAIFVFILCFYYLLLMSFNFCKVSFLPWIPSVLCLLLSIDAAGKIQFWESGLSAREPTLKKTIPHLPPIHQFCVDSLFSHLMLQVIFCRPWQHWHHKWKTAHTQRRKPFPLLSPYHQFCVDALFSHLMLQVIFCGPWQHWHHKWKTSDIQRRKPFPFLSPYHQLIDQCNKYFLFVCNLILTWNQMDVILL